MARAGSRDEEEASDWSAVGRGWWCFTAILHSASQSQELVPTPAGDNVSPPPRLSPAKVYSIDSYTEL